MLRLPPNPLQGLKKKDLRALGIGLELSAVIGGGAWIGSWADGKLDTDPWLALTGTVLGLTGGCWHALKMANDGKLPYIPGITKDPDAKTAETKTSKSINLPDEVERNAPADPLEESNPDDHSI